MRTFARSLLCSALLGVTAFLVAGVSPSVPKRNRIEVRFSKCVPCRTEGPSVGMWDLFGDTPVSPNVLSRNAEGLVVLTEAGYYNAHFFLKESKVICQGDRSVAVLPGHDRLLDVPMRCWARAKNAPIAYVSLGPHRMNALAGYAPASVQSATLRDWDGSELTPGTVSNGAYYFDRVFCKHCIVELTLADGEKSTIAATLDGAENFSVVRKDLGAAEVARGTTVRGSPYNAPETLVEGPAGSVWALDRLGNRVFAVFQDGHEREIDLPTPFAAADSIVSSGSYVWVSERSVGRIVRFSADGSMIEFPIGMKTNFVDDFSLAAGLDGRIWFAGDDGVGVMDARGAVKSVGSPVGFTRGYALAVGSDGRVWYAGYGCLAVFDGNGRWRQVSDRWMTSLLAGTHGLWGASDDALAYIGNDGTVRDVHLPIAGMGVRMYAVDSADNLWFSDGLGNVIAKVSPHGEIVARYGGSKPFGISAMAIARNGQTWIAEPGLPRLEKVDGSPGLQGQVYAFPPRGASPTYLFVDSLGRLWYSDPKGDVVGMLYENAPGDANAYGQGTCYALKFSSIRSCRFEQMFNVAGGTTTIPSPKR